MDSMLFAFRVARPVEAAGDGPLEFSYDPQSQTAVWSGAATAIARLHCTNAGHGGYKCTAYGNYCTTYGGGGVMFCDS